MARDCASGTASLFGSTRITFHTAAGTSTFVALPMKSCLASSLPVPPRPCGPHAMYSSFPFFASVRHSSSSNRQAFWLLFGACGTMFVM